MKIKFWIFILACLIGSQSHADTLLTYWNFNNSSSTFSNPNFGSLSTTSASYGEQYDSTLVRLYANTANSTIFSDSSIYIDLSNLTGVANGGSTGQTSWGLYSTTASNKVSSDSSSGGGSLAVFGSANTNKYITFNLSSAGYASLTASYAERTSNVTTPQQIWSYSLDGITYTSLATFGTTSGSWVVQTISLPTELDNLSVFYLRLTYDNTGSSVSSSIDNFQLTGIAIPETSTYVLLGIGGLILVLACSRSKQIVIS